MAGKAELAEAVAEAEGITVVRSKAIVDTVFSALLDLLADGEEVQVRGFGTFRLVTSDDRQGRNPRTGEKIDIPGRTKIHFKSSRL